MAKKRNPENDLARSTGAAAAPAKARRTASARPKHAPATAETPVTEKVTLSSVSGVKDEPSHEEIAQLAYTFWLSRGCSGGSPEDDWFRAELELRSQTPVAAA